MFKKFNNEKGFSLAELGIAMVILLILATISTIAYFTFIDNAKEVKVVEDASILQSQLAYEMAKNGDKEEFYNTYTLEVDYQNEIKPSVKEVLEYHINSGSNLVGTVFTNEVFNNGKGEKFIGELKMKDETLVSSLLNELFSPVVVSADDLSESSLEVRKINNNKVKEFLQSNVDGDWYIVVKHDRVVTESDYNDDGNENEEGNEESNEEGNEEEEEELVSTNPACFVFDDSTGTITDYLCNDTDVVIPSKINGVEVVIIGELSMTEKNLTSVVIPNSVENIELGAFYINELSSVVIPNSVKNIGDWAFSQNKLPEIIIPDSVTSIGEGAFLGNELTSIVIPNSITSISVYTFGENKITSVVIPNSVTSIGGLAFAENELTSIDIPNSVTSIGNGAFRLNELTSVVIPNSVTSIEMDVFMKNQLTSIVIPDSVTSIDLFAFSQNQIKEAYIPSSVVEIHRGAFGNNHPDFTIYGESGSEAERIASEEGYQFISDN